MDLKATKAIVEGLRKRGWDVTYNPNPSEEELDRIYKLMARTKKVREDAIKRYNKK